MIFRYMWLYFLIILTGMLLPISISYRILIITSLFLLFQYTLYYNSAWNLRDSLPNVKSKDLYDLFQDGDVIMSNVYPYTKQPNRYIASFLNCGLIHNFLITEENGIKYVMSGHMDPECAQEKRLLVKVKTINNRDFYVYKEPLMEYLLQNRNNYIHQIYRHPTCPIKITSDDMTWNENERIYYCTHTLTHILVRKGKMQKRALNMSYRPQRLVDELKKHGYQMTTIRQV